MNRLPVSEDKLTLILNFLKENSNHAYTRRQIAEHLWANYSFCEFKTFDQLNREVSDKLTVHVNKSNRYTQTVPLQVTEHNTSPYSYQYCGELQDTKLENFQLSFDLENNPIVFKIEADETVDIETVDEAVLVMDVQAAVKINLDLILDSLTRYLEITNDKQEAIMRVLEVIETSR
jgi:Rps23 Pro-64 3,4-dihydroxylase Tpa1-like proline 4-hydroxylase